MQDYYYLEANYNIIDGKRKITSFDLYNSGKLIKEFNKEETKKIKEEMHKQRIKPKDKKGYIYIDNDLFIRHVLRILNTKKRNPVNKKMLGIIVGTTLLALGGINNLSNNKHNTPPIVAEAADISDDFKDLDIIEVEDTDNNENEKIENYIDTNIERTDDIVEPEEVDTPLVYNEEPSEIINQVIDNGFENIFEFSFEDRSNSENVSLVNNNYSYLIDTYSNRYGIDPKLMSAIICQENPTNIKNYTEFAGHGVPQIEWIHNNSSIYAYNFEINQNESSGPIDVLRCTDDQDYSIKIASMIMNHNYNDIHENYGYKLTKEQELAATVWAYNKGITIIEEALANTNSYEDFINYVLVNSIGGDNEYIEHVFSYLEDQEIITMKTRDGLLNSVMIDNTTVENQKKSTTL